MKNNKETISANEINKYTYCPYQWYYERLYGRQYIRRKYKERNELYHLEDSVTSNFNKGLKYHKNYGFFVWLERLFKIILLLAIAFGIYFLYIYLKGF